MKALSLLVIFVVIQAVVSVPLLVSMWVDDLWYRGLYDDDLHFLVWVIVTFVYWGVLAHMATKFENSVERTLRMVYRLDEKLKLADKDWF